MLCKIEKIERSKFNSCLLLPNTDCSSIYIYIYIYIYITVKNLVDFTGCMYIKSLDAKNKHNTVLLTNVL